MSGPSTGFLATSHHLSLSDVLAGYCLPFLTAFKDFGTLAGVSR